MTGSKQEDLAQIEPLEDLVKFMRDRGDSPEQIGLNVVRLCRVRELVGEASCRNSDSAPP